MNRLIFSTLLFLVAMPAIAANSGAATGADKKIIIAVIGDYGAVPKEEEHEVAVAKMINGWQPDYIATVGDNNYPRGEASTIDKNIGRFFSAYIGDYHGKYPPKTPAKENRFFPSLGNHDLECDGCPKPYTDYFSALPGNKRYYDVQKGSIHFFILDTGAGSSANIGPDSTQGKWLKQVMSQSKAKYKLIFFHHAPYSSNKDHGSSPKMRWPFKEWGATAVFSGHDHDYERLLVNGIPYFVVGNGGNGLESDASALSETKSLKTDVYGALRITVSSDGILYEAFAVPNKVIDSFKGPARKSSKN